jgi:hypothetical protein
MAKESHHSKIKKSKKKLRPRRYVSPVSRNIASTENIDDTDSAISTPRTAAPITPSAGAHPFLRYDLMRILIMAVIVFVILIILALVL